MILLLMADLSFGQERSNAASAVDVNYFNYTSVADLKYIWSVTGIEKDRITMALNKDGTDVFGRAKYEPENSEHWNGEVAGWVSGDQVYLTLTVLKGNKQISSILDGILEDHAFSGRFFQTSEGKILTRGEFNAKRLNPDLSSYIPSKMPAITANLTVPPGTNQTVQQTILQKSRFYDVRQDPLRFILI
jgi:hypothetical protein